MSEPLLSDQQMKSMRLHVEQAERDGHGHTISGERILDLLAEVAARDERIAELTAGLRKMVDAACQAPMSDGEAECWYGYVPEFIAEEALALLSPLSERPEP